MGKTFDVGLERLTGIGVPGIGETQEGGVTLPLQDAVTDLKFSPYLDATETKSAQPEMAVPQGSTFYLETFGCQMNDHDSEKVAGVLLGRGYRQGETPEAAKVILYNTCSIREKAAQKVFSRLGELRPAEERQGKRFNTEGTEEEQRVHQAENGAGSRSAQARVPVPQEAKHPSLRKIVNAGGGKIIGVLGCVAQQ